MIEAGTHPEAQKQDLAMFWKTNSISGNESMLE